MTHRQPIPSTITLALIGASISSLVPSAAAQNDVSYVASQPRTTFTSAPDDALAGFTCHPIQCKTSDGVGDGWNESCTTNTSCFPVLLVTCADSDLFGLSYTIKILWPGETRWTNIFTPPGLSSWIQDWALLPFDPDADGLEFAYATADGDANGVMKPTMAGTLQVASIDGFEPVTSATVLNSVGASPVTVQRTFQPGPRGMQIIEDWTGAAGSPMNRIVTTAVTHDAAGFHMTCLVDVGKDGTTDHRTALRYDEQASGNFGVQLDSFGAGDVLLQSITANMVLSGTRAATTIVSDNDGDGVADHRQTESTWMDGELRHIDRTSQVLGDATTSRRTASTILSRNARDATMTEMAFDENGQLSEAFRIEMAPTPVGYTMETWRDTDGDRVEDVRMLRMSTVAPALGGLDQEILGLDLGNDGTYEAFSSTGALKTLSGTTYSEIVASDRGADGSIEAITTRAVELQSSN